jgi:hypothetical protein
VFVLWGGRERGGGVHTAYVTGKDTRAGKLTVRHGQSRPQLVEVIFYLGEGGGESHPQTLFYLFLSPRTRGEDSLLFVGHEGVVLPARDRCGHQAARQGHHLRGAPVLVVAQAQLACGARDGMRWSGREEGGGGGGCGSHPCSIM